MDATCMARCVTEIFGTRTSLVFTSKSDASSIKQHIDYIEDGEQRNRVIGEKMAEIMAEQEAHNRLAEPIREQMKARYGDAISIVDGIVKVTNSEMAKSEIGYLLTNTTLTMKRTKKALRLKKAALSKISETWSSEHRRDEEEKPAPVFYTYEQAEQERWDKDKSPNPFLSERERKETALETGALYTAPKRARNIANGRVIKRQKKS